MRLRKYTEKQLAEAVVNSYSFRSVLTKLGVAPYGGNYAILRKAIKVFALDISHFTGQGHLRNKTHTYTTRPLESVLVRGKVEATNRLRLRLISEGLKVRVCESCGLVDWKDKPIPLELHHVDGDRANNELQNLQLLCPNCHALTDNYRGKNKKA